MQIFAIVIKVCGRFFFNNYMLSLRNIKKFVYRLLTKQSTVITQFKPSLCSDVSV